ncbi:MAG: [FeFe] hydrogenase H-cluster maturation GTPase HydF [Dorea sp.]|nr:[FeFe] hydrogenase H-cluster maturation GTPase HydF [Dorea sp.]
MSLNSTPSGNRTHIGIFGKRNAGKSSLINAITGQELSIVSDIKGTTTDPVLKSMEILPLGPVVLIDTPGLDDEGELGGLRISKAYQMLNKTDIAVLVIDGNLGITEEDLQILARIQEKEIPYVIAVNKCDETEDSACDGETSSQSICQEALARKAKTDEKQIIKVSARTKTGIQELKNLIAVSYKEIANDRPLIADKVQPMDFVVLVIPIDAAAPKARLILPQQQTIRDLLEAGAVSIVCKDTELADTLAKLSAPPALVITDSQAFQKVAKIVPEDIALTSFSIMFARFKGNLKTLVNGAYALDQLKDGDHVLISEGCTHHRQCGDIGTDKLPRWIREYTKKQLTFDFTSGTGFPSDLSPYKMIIHCGGCMLKEKEMKFRMSCAEDAKIPMTNYGTAISYMKGILDRSTKIFEDELSWTGIGPTTTTDL